MDNGKKFALRMAALMLCLFTVSAALSSCGFFADSYLENNTGIAVKTQGKTEKTYPETTLEGIPDTTLQGEGTNLPETEKTPTTTAHEATRAPETTKAPETTTPETTLPPEQLDNIPDDVQNHVYLTYKNNGRCEELIGNVKVTVVLISDEVSTWNSAAESELSKSLSSQEKSIEEIAASYGKKLDITFNYIGAKVTGDAAAGDYSEGWINAAANSIGYESIKSMQKELDSKNSADSNPILFALNKTGRAYANYSTGKTGCEYLVVFSSDYSSFNHELYHVYGARDFYYPNEVAELASTYLSDSIMSNGDVTDPLTAFIIGWDDEIDAEAYEFLKKTSHLTKEYLDEANKAQSVTGYVTEHKLDYGTYTGYLERGVPTGEGTLWHNDGTILSGTFLSGNLNGKGKSIYASGDSYEGDWVNGVRTGQGKYTWANGSMYVGDFVNGECTGKGTYTWANGDVYVGDFVSGKRTGKGTYTWANGNVYVGDFVNSEQEGQGTITRIDGSSYTGSFIAGRYDGFGTAVFAGGNSYEGYWSSGVIHGKGTYTWVDGGEYTGDFYNGQMHGTGKQKYSNGSIYEGNFSEGKRHGTGTMVYADGDTYTGGWNMGNPHGNGTYTYAGGNRYTGEWQNGTITGYGKFVWTTGESYEGNWVNGKRHGYGKYINKNGKVYAGEWVNDVFQN